MPQTANDTRTQTLQTRAVFASYAALFLGLVIALSVALNHAEPNEALHHIFSSLWN